MKFNFNADIPTEDSTRSYLMFVLAFIYNWSVPVFAAIFFVTISPWFFLLAIPSAMFRLEVIDESY